MSATLCYIVHEFIYYFRLMLDQSKSELQQTTEQLSEKYESINDEGIKFVMFASTCKNI